MSVPRFSVIVPAHDSAGVLPRVLGAIAASDISRADWELIVVDDASTDDTAVVASRFADRVIRLPAPASGPAHARNRGVEASSGTWLVFVDADVVLHDDALGELQRVISAQPDVTAVFGAYDDAPPAPGFLSQYRNLLHRYVHVESAGEADTFWSGCGAVRRDAFDAIGGFDARRFPRPQIEDIDLGYRLRDRGGRIVLHPRFQGAHLKRWRLIGSLRTDLFDRGVPWVRLLLERGKLGHAANLNLKQWERAKAVATVVALGLTLLGAATMRVTPAVVGAMLLAAVAWSKRGQIRWFAERRGVVFAAMTIPFIWSYYLVSAMCVALGVAQHLAAGFPIAGASPLRPLSRDRHLE